MYLDNPEKLYEDLRDITFLTSWMETTKQYGQHLDVDNLISIVEDEIKKCDDGFSPWNLDDAQNMAHYNIIKENIEKLKSINKKVQKEKETMIKCKYCGSYKYNTSTIYSEDYGYIAYAVCDNCHGGVKTTDDNCLNVDYCGQTRYESIKNVKQLYKLINTNIDNSKLIGFIIHPELTYQKGVIK